MELNGRVALVTGGAGGIGGAVVRRLAKAGVSAVAVNYRRSAKEAEALALEIERAGVKAMALQADVQNDGQVRAMIDKLGAQFGRLDILVNNAGVFVTGEVGDSSTDVGKFDRQFAVNVGGVAAAVRAAATVMGEGGRIISIGSAVGTHVPFPGIADYAATKAAVVGYTKGWARDLGPKGITVNTVQPGPIDTDMNPADGELAKQMTAFVPLGRYGRVEEIAGAVAFLAGPAATFITGTTLTVDGGVAI